MKLVIDLSSRLAITDFANATPAQTYVIKSQDTAVLNVYFVQNALVQDLGSATTLKFGLVQSGLSTLLVLDTVFNRMTDSSGNVFYQGFPVFNTSALLTALGSSVSISCTGEVRYQQPDGEIVHCLDIPFTVFRTILAEATSTTTTADFTQPNVGSNVNVAVVTTSFLSANDVVTIGTNGDSYNVVSVTDATHFVAENLGTGTTAPSSNVAHPATVQLASPNVLATYPDVSTIELKVHKDQPCGYAGLSCTGSGYINNIHVLVDGNTVTNTDPAGLARADKLTYLTASFVQPAANATVVATVANSIFLALNQAVYILEGGYYIVTVISGTSVTLQNNGDPANEPSGDTIPNGAALVPAQAVSGGGTPGTNGINAFTTLTASFTTPAVNANVTIAVGTTAWIGGAGQVLFIASAGYYSVVGVVDATHVSVQNLGTASNVIVGTLISSGSNVTPGGATGAAAAAGFAAYDTTATSFVMPAALATVSVVMHNTAWLSANQVVYVGTAGYFTVSSITNATTAVLANANYPGNTGSGTTVSSGSTVSPGGLIGATGSGGAGKNAFTTLTSNFTQPAVSSTVSIVVATTAFMTAGQILYIAGGGYYSISSVTDLTDVVVTNLGYAGNASPTSTVTGSGTQLITAGGTAGSSGVNAYTTTSASFTMPAPSSTVTVQVGNTGWMAAGQNIYIPSAGYFTVSTVTDATHVVLTNSGTVGNASTGTIISSSSVVAPAGPAGSATVGGGAVNLTDAETSTGVSVIANAGGILKRLTSVDGSLTLTDNGTSIDHSISSSKTTFDPANGLYFYDDFTGFSSSDTRYIINGGTGGGTGGMSAYGQNATLKAIGTCELNVTTVSSGTPCVILVYGQANNKPATSGQFTPGIGALTFKTRVAFPTPLPGTGGSYFARFGLFGYSGAVSSTWSSLSTVLQNAFFEYSPDQNSGQWRVAVGTTSANYSNTTVGVSADTFYTLELDINAAGTSYVFKINGTTVATITANLPTGPMYSMFLVTRAISPATNWLCEVDYLYLLQTLSR